MGAAPGQVFPPSAGTLDGCDEERTCEPPQPSQGAGTVDLYADDSISDARRVADPQGVNLARWCTLCGRVLYARNGTSGTATEPSRGHRGSASRRKMLARRSAASAAMPASRRVGVALCFTFCAYSIVVFASFRSVALSWPGRLSSM